MAWRYCGNQVKLWRMRAGVSRESLGEKAGYEYESVKSMEQGRRRPSLRLLEIADEMCGAQGLLLAAREYLKPERFPARTLEFMQLEGDAIAIHSYEPLLIPGLLQTEEYARALMGNSCPPLDDETIEERVAARLQRQEKLRDKPKVAFGFVIYEAALRTSVGGPEVMRRQLNRLLEVGELRNVSIQVLPVGRGAYSGLGGSLVLLETAEHDHYALVEGQRTSVLHSTSETISALTQRHGMIRMQALSAEESAQFIKKVAEEL
ncbi:Scr1 family TA system antitoxin-like transcriptional regulator [Streptomyces sp. NPDC054933]